MAWVIVLVGAVVAASLPELGRDALRRRSGSGWSFRLALETLSALEAMQHQPPHGLSLNELAQALRIELRHAHRVVKVLHELHWIGQLRPMEGSTESRYVLLADLQVTPLAPLAEALLVSQDDSSHHVWRHMGIAQLHVADVLAKPR